MIDQLPQWLQIFLYSMIPGVEAKMIVPYFIYESGWIWWKAYLIGLAGNMFLVPFGLLFFHKAENYLRKYPKIEKIMDKFFSRVRRRANKKVERYEELAILFFVAIPLPLTGAGLGTLIAYLFNLKFSNSILIIFIGVVIATSITTFLILF